MKKNFRLILLLLISMTPLNRLRIFLYRNILKYKVDYSSRIGMFNIIDCEIFIAQGIRIKSFNFLQVQKFICGKYVVIKRFNRFRDMHEIKLYSNSMIVSKNIFTGTANFLSPFTDVFCFELGENSILTNNHYIDCAGKVSVGSNVVFGGRNSEVWTHGFDSKRTMIVGNVKIGDNVYIGSNSKILQGAIICNDVSIGAGTIVSRNIYESGFYVSSQLIRKADTADYSTNNQTIEYEGAKFYRK